MSKWVLTHDGVTDKSDYWSQLCSGSAGCWQHLCADQDKQKIHSMFNGEWKGDWWEVNTIEQYEIWWLDLLQKSILYWCIHLFHFKYKHDKTKSLNVYALVVMWMSYMLADTATNCTAWQNLSLFVWHKEIQMNLLEVLVSRSGIFKRVQGPKKVQGVSFLQMHF